MFSGGPSLTARLANIQHMPVLIAATVASEKPTDGYLVKDVIKMSFESPQTRAFLQQYLLNQLVTSRNVYVKKKVLKLIEELLLRGHIEFKQNLRKQPEPLNEASRLRSDSKDGALMAECIRIRDLANKILELLYEETPELQRKRCPSPEYRSTHDSSSSSSSASRIQGFGNTSYVPRTKSSTTSDKLKILFGSSTKATPLVYDPSYATMDPVPHNVSGGTTSSAGGGHATGRYHGLPEGAPHRSGEAGGGWGTDGSPSQPSPQVREQVAKEEYHAEDTQECEERNTEQERRLVDDITAPGGIKAAPPRDSINNFISRCKVLDCLAIVEYLRHKLQEEEQAQVVLRTLFVVEAMLKSDIPDILSYLDLILEELNGLTQSTNSSVRAKAKKILHQLVAEESQRVTSSGTGSEPAVGVASSGTGTILDLEGDRGGERGAGEEDHTEEGSGGVVKGLFDGMSVSGQSPGSAAGPPSATVRPNHTHKKSSSPRLAARSRAEAKKEDNNSPFGDLLGLSSSEIQSNPVEPPSQATAEGDISLMDLGEDKEDFDPLIRTGSVGSRSNSLTRSSSLGNLKATPISPPSTSDSIMNQLSGLDLSLSTPLAQTDTGIAQNGLRTDPPGVLQPFPLQSSLVPLTSSYTPTSSTSNTTLLSGSAATSQSPMGVMMGGAPINYVNAQMAHMGYMATASPYAMQVAPGLAQQGRSAYGPTPLMMYMNQPRLGGDSRPVQRAQVHDETPESGFDFLGKSSKGSAFDFVKDEIDSAKKK